MTAHYPFRKVTRAEARASGFVIDDSCYPPIAYKGPRFAPESSITTYTELEEEYCSVRAELTGAVNAGAKYLASLAEVTRERDAAREHAGKLLRACNRLTRERDAARGSARALNEDAAVHAAKCIDLRDEIATLKRRLAQLENIPERRAPWLVHRLGEVISERDQARAETHEYAALYGMVPPDVLMFLRRQAELDAWAKTVEACARAHTPRLRACFAGHIYSGRCHVCHGAGRVPS